jgi:hypothetical protein
MEHGKVVVGMFLPADEEATEAVQPGVGTLDDPASGAPPGFLSPARRSPHRECADVA